LYNVDSILIYFILQEKKFVEIDYSIRFSSKLKGLFMNYYQGIVHIFWIIALSLMITAIAGPQAQDDPVECFKVDTPPVIDGVANDACWEVAKWQSIDQTWIPWGEVIDPADFTGRYKTIWSSEENLIYFAVEITDDVISDAYVNGQTADVYNFDMIEVFIDQDKSGGEHRYDSGTSNAENAFGYHIFSKFPESGETNSIYEVSDMGQNYHDHFPEFVLGRVDHVSTWEFSLIVYDDTYSFSNKDGARVTLVEGAEMGLSLAANDDDQPEINPLETQRDNMIGSVAVPQEHNNDHWINADYFGTVKLMGKPNVIKTGAASHGAIQFQVFPNPAKNYFQIKTGNAITGLIEVKLYNLLGQQVYQNSGRQSSQRVGDLFFTHNLNTGVYFVEIDYNDQRYFQKVLLTK